MKLPLEGIRVLDVTDSIAGPATTLLLASWGAEVIRVESRLHLGFRKTGPWGPKGNDPIPTVPEKDIDFSQVNLEYLLSPIFAQFNSNKMSISLNLTKPEGRELFKRLVEVSDIVIDNYRFGVMQGWGLAYTDLKQVKSDIIVINMHSMGRGPYEGWITWGMNLMSFTGFSNGWGHPDTDPINRCGSRSYGDYVSAWKAAVAILATLFYRANTGRGQYIELSQVEATTSVLGPTYLDYFVNNRLTPPRGNRHPQFAPYNCYRCKGDDRWCVIAVFNEEEWQQFCEAIGSPSWTGEPRFADMASRLGNVEELDKNVEKWTILYTPHQVMRILQSFGVSAGAVQNAEDLYHDVQLRARGYVVEQELPRLGKVDFSGTPLHFSSSRAAPYRRAPVLGEHNDYVYRRLLGLSNDEIEAMVDSQVIL